MRSKIFEEALINMKLRSTFSVPQAREDTLRPDGKDHWTAEETLRKENIETISHVLSQCRMPQTKTQIMHKNSLDGAQFSGCVNYLFSQDMLAEVGGKLVTTEKGKSLLELFAKLKGFFGLDQLE